MDSPSGSSQTSAWGGFLKKAMEGVEQQLDRVLENPPPKAREAAAQAATKKENASPSPGRLSVGTPGGGGRMTLQERLAASIAKSRTGSPVTVVPGSPKRSEELPQGISRSSSSVDLTRIETNGLPSSKEGVPESLIRLETPKVPLSPARDESPAIEVKETQETKTLPVWTDTPDIVATPPVDEQDPSQSIEALVGADLSAPSESAIQDIPLQIPSLPPLPPTTDPAVVELISQLRNDLETCEFRRIEEAQEASLRISSLEQKLKILSQSSLEAAHNAASDPSATPLDRKLAEREGKIALLLDEGEKLAKIELNLMTVIKGLRAKQKEDATTISTAVTKAEKAERQVNELKTQLKRANEVERKNVERLKGMYKTDAANEALRREKESAQAALAEANTRADEAVAQIQTEALENERRLTAEFKEKLERLQTETTLIQEQSKSEIQVLKGRLQREQASSKSLRAEFTAEISTLESKLEVLRSREEESSTSATSSAQAKLMRQIEMLQTQHAIASQNWQRIEGSLQHRNEGLEKERSDIMKKLDEEKKKLRDAADAKRNVQNQLDGLKRQIKSLESDILKVQSENQALHETIASLETRLSDQETSFNKEKEAMAEEFELTMDTRLKEEKTKWEEDQQIMFSSPLISTPLTPFPQLVPSPTTSRPSPRPRNSVSPQPEIALSKQRGSFPTSRAASFGDLSHLRRPSRHFNNAFESTPSLPPPPLEDEDAREFLNKSPGESPKDTAVDALSISASTSTAGPSVNIIERMSAAVRRLESDLTSAKEELARSVRQRDEAREECIKLMVEVDEKRTCQDANRLLQTQFNDLEVRYNEALVLLGEKSERVEELQMDIVDLKEGYQHALERLVGAK